MLVLKPSSAQLELIRSARDAEAAKAVELVHEHEAIRTRVAREFRAGRQRTFVDHVDMEFTSTIVETLDYLRRTEPRIVNRPAAKLKKVYPLHLTCPIVELARIN